MRGPGKPNKISKWLWDISTSGMPSLLTRRVILENIFNLVLWKPIDLQHLLDKSTSVVTNIQDTPSTEKTANPTSSHSCRCNGFWTLSGYKTKAVVLSTIFERDTESVWRYTISLSAAWKRKMDINLTRVDRENNVNLSASVHNSRRFLSTHRPFAPTRCSASAQGPHCISTAHLNEPWLRCKELTEMMEDMEIFKIWMYFCWRL